MQRRVWLSEEGASILLVPLVITSALLIAALAFGGWAFSQMLDYKNNVNTKVQTAVAQAKQQEDAAKDAAFAEAEKQPLHTYTGPAAYGSVTISYPKTWSAYIADNRQSSPFVDGYFYPNYVPDTQAANSVYALRVQVVQDSYTNVLSQFSSSVSQGTATVVPYKLPRVPSVIGSRVDGQLTNTTSGTMIILPLRNTTLKIWTEASQFEQDFNTYILPNVTFAP